MQHDSLEFWIDVNLPSILAEWISKEYNLKAKTFRELNFENVKDYEVLKMLLKIHR
jgi:predicted nuclease of predicted toxin-antitoxin system